MVMFSQVSKGRFWSLPRGIYVQRVLCLGGSLSRGVSVRGISIQGISVQGVLCLGGSLSRGVCLVGFCPGGLCPGSFLSRGSLSKETPLYGKERAVLILLECMLVRIFKLWYKRPGCCHNASKTCEFFPFSTKLLEMALQCVGIKQFHS